MTRTREHDRWEAAAPRRRLIAEPDVAEVAALLAAAFPRRGAAAWRLGLARLGAREPPAGLPRYGVLLEAEGRIVGALLTICAEVVEEAGRSPRCNLSSWYVEPRFAAQAPSLLGPLLRRIDVTLFNISPARHTEAILAAQGFEPFCRGSLLLAPAAAAGGRAHALSPGDAAAFPEREMLEAHLAWGCPCFAAGEGGDTQPFVFARPQRLRQLLPASRLVYCRDLAGFRAHAGGLGRALLRRGVAGVLVDAPAPLAGLPGLRVARSQGRFFRGPHPPRPGDLAYSEAALFPP